MATSTEQQLPPRPNAIATLLTTDSFSPGVLALLHSVRKTLSTPGKERSSSSSSTTLYYPPDLTVLVTPNVSNETRQLISLFATRVLVVEPIPSPDTRDECDETPLNNGDTGDKKPSAHVASWNDAGYTKLRIWELVQYKCIAYVDADCVAVQDLGHLFGDTNVGPGCADWNGFAAAPDIFPPDRFNAGFLLIRPNKTIAIELLSKVTKLPSYDGGDTGYLNAYFEGWYHHFPPSSRLSFGYNAQRTLHQFTHKKQPGYWKDVQQKLKVIHYSSTPKPWETLKESYDETDLERIWWETYEDSQKWLREAKKKQKQEEEASRKMGVATLATASSPTSRPTAPAAAGRRRKHPSATATHDLVNQKYREYRKGGMDSKTAMARARAESGHSDADGDPGLQVASMFGLSQI